MYYVGSRGGRRDAVTLETWTEVLPLRTDADGVVRISGTRVTLDTVVEAFNEGATAEEISSQYSSLDLADIYAVIGYYLRHREEMTAYLDRRRGEVADVRREIERRFDPRGLRERLLALRAAQT